MFSEWRNQACFPSWQLVSPNRKEEEEGHRESWNRGFIPRVLWTQVLLTAFSTWYRHYLPVSVIFRMEKLLSSAFKNVQVFSTPSLLFDFLPFLTWSNLSLSFWCQIPWTCSHHFPDAFPSLCDDLPLLFPSLIGSSFSWHSTKNLSDKNRESG